MKKTIAMTLVALSSMAVGAVPEGTTEEIWKLDFTSSGTTVTKKDGVTLTDPWPDSTGTGSFYTTDGLQMHQNKYTFDQTAGQLTFADEFALIVTLQYNALPDPPQNKPHKYDWPVLFGLGTDKSDTSPHDWKVSYYAVESNPTPDDATRKGKLTLDNDFYAADDTALHKNFGNVVLGVGKTYTLMLYNSGNDKGDDSGMVRLYVAEVENNVQGTFTEAGNVKIVNSDDSVIRYFALGGNIYSNNNDDSNESNITVSSAALYKYVPEPTTATLSLLALAGLVARRRRK